LQTFVSILVTADVTIKLSKDIYKTRTLQKNRSGVLELNWTIPGWVRKKAHLGFGKYNTFLSEFDISLLQLSKQCIRLRLVNVVSLDREVRSIELTEITDAKIIQLLMNDIYRLTHVPMCLTDMKGSLVVSVGWQDICTKLYRFHPKTYYKHWIDHIKTSSEVLPGEFKLYKYKNSMLDMVASVSIGGREGYLHFGHFFFEDEPLDYEPFRSQARKYGSMSRNILLRLKRFRELVGSLCIKALASH
jgi:Predicted histidine kinase sensor domain.